jgi:hypothetical protein
MLRTVSQIVIPIIILFLLGVLFYHNIEGFGTSPGTLVQLASTHVHSSPYQAQQELLEERERIRRDLIDMTGY